MATRGERPRRNGTISILVSTSDGGRTRQLQFSRSTARILLVACAALLFLFLAALAGVIGLAGKAVRADRLAAENDSLRRQFVRLEDLEKELGRMVALSEQMRALAGVGGEDSGLPPETSAEGGGEAEGSTFPEAVVTPGDPVAPAAGDPAEAGNHTSPGRRM